MLTKIFVLLYFLVSLTTAEAAVKVVTTTTNLKALVQEIGGDKVEVVSFCRGTQDPHYLEAKPSFMIKAYKADLLVNVGLDLEIGWLPLIVKGARNPKIKIGRQGRLELGRHIKTIEIPTGDLSRRDGDVHPEGNPHFMLDPIKAIEAGLLVKQKLIELNSDNKAYYQSRFDDFSQRIKSFVEKTQKKIVTKRVMTYHKTLNYFFKRFAVETVGVLEPKPGIPPSASHVLKMIKLAKDRGVSKILVESYFDPSVAKRVAKEVKGMTVVKVPVAVEKEKNISSLFDLYQMIADQLL